MYRAYIQKLSVTHSLPMAAGSRPHTILKEKASPNAHPVKGVLTKKWPGDELYVCPPLQKENVLESTVVTSNICDIVMDLQHPGQT